MGLQEYGIPEDKLPHCWSDDIRMNALFAPFRLKTANPESWDMKMKFWSDMLRTWCRCKGDAVVSAADAKVAFHRRGRTPACIDIVVEEMYRNGELVPISKYQQILHYGPEGWVRWGARLAFKPAALALTAVSSLLPGRQAVDSDGLPKASIESTQRFVLESVLKEQATSLLHSYPGGVERVGTKDELMRRCDWQAGREAFEIALGWLVHNGLAVVKGDVVKLAEPDKKAEPVTEIDEAVVKLVSAEARLEGDARRLSRDVASAANDARAALQLGNKPAAKNHLRRKHTAAERLTRCHAALDNVRHLQQHMRDVDSNRAIVDTYKTTSEAMKRGMKDGGLDEDAVHDTMDDLRDVMETYNEVEKALSATTEDLDAAELEAELKELLASPGAPPSGGAAVTEKRDTKLPSPPAANPTPRKFSEREFVFDGEERIIAELNELGVEEATPPPAPRQRAAKAPLAEGVAEGWIPPISNEKPPKRPTPAESPEGARWCPPAGERARPDGAGAGAGTWQDDYELRQDERLHPGQPLNIDYATPPRLYSTDFQVHDHKLDSGVWLYNPRNDTDTLGASTEYYSSESPGKSSGNFQMAPGGERKNSHHWPEDDEPTAEDPDHPSTLQDLERRLKNLRGFNL